MAPRRAARRRARVRGGLAAVGLAVVIAIVAVSCGGDPPEAAREETTGTEPGAEVRAGSTPATPASTPLDVATTTTIAPVPPTTPVAPEPAPSTVQSLVPTTAPDAGAPTTIALPTSSQTIPAGTSPEDVAWCTDAQPVAEGLRSLFILTIDQLDVLVEQALALRDVAPSPVQPKLTVLADIGGRYLVALRGGTATLTMDGIVRWASENLTPAEQSGFLTSAGDIVSYIDRTC